MARGAIAAQLSGNPYETALGTLTFNPTDATNFNSTPLTGQQVLIFWNSDASSHTVTIHSVADAEGRTSDITTQAVAAGAYLFTSRLPLIGWQQADGNLYFDTNNALVKVAVLTIQ